MTLVQIIADIISQMNDDFTFLHGDKAEQNLSDDTTFPIAYLGFPIKSKETMPKSGILISETPIEIYFGMKSENDWTTDQHETNCIATMRLARKEFIVRCMKDTRLREVVPTETLDVKLFLDVITSGCLFSMNVKTVDATSICL